MVIGLFARQFLNQKGRQLAVDTAAWLQTSPQNQRIPWERLNDFPVAGARSPEVVEEIWRVVSGQAADPPGPDDVFIVDTELMTEGVSMKREQR